MTIKLTVDAIAKYNNRIVLVERKHEPFGYALPGGHVNENESLEAAIRRELKEETSLNISSLEQFRTYSDPNRDPRGRRVSTVFVCDAYGKLKAADDAKSAKVISLDEIDGIKNEFAFDHYQILSDYRQSLQGPAISLPGRDLLWEVHHMSSYYDNDPRMPGIVPIDERYYFVVDSRDEALQKAYRHKPKLKNLKQDDEIDVKPIPLENLAIARNSKNEGRMGYHSMCHLAAVKLSSEEDKARYTLGAVLIPK